MSRGRGSKGGRTRLPGDWVTDFEKLQPENVEETSRFPPYKVPTAAPPTQQEKREVANYKHFRDEMHEGPFYVKSRKLNLAESKKTYASDENRSAIKSQQDFDPFTGVPTYSMKYDRKANAVPQLTGPFNKDLFPEELWPTLEGKEGDAARNTINRGLRKKAHLQAQMSRAASETTPEERRNQVLEEKLKNVTEEEVEAEAELDEEAEPEEEDYDYVDDEEELGDDYNAEKYFDGGDGDDDDGGDGGGDDY